MKRPVALILTDSHGSFRLLEKIFTLTEKIYPSVEFIFHLGDIGAYDENSLERLSPKEKNLFLRHQNSMDEFIPYLSGRKKFPMPMYHIQGNHEDFFLYEQLNKEFEYNIDNWFPVSLGQLYRRVTASKMFTFTGIGKIHPRGFDQKKKCLCNYISEEELLQLRKNLSSRKIQPDILMMHEPPLIRKCDRHCDFGHPAFTKIVKEVQPQIVLSGHMHFSYYTKLGASRIYGIPAAKHGFFGLLYDDMNVSIFHVDNPEKEIAFDHYPPGIEKDFYEKIERKKRKTVSGKYLMNHFNLWEKVKQDPSLAGQVGKIIGQIRQKEKLEKNFTIEKALAFAEDCLLKKLSEK